MDKLLIDIEGTKYINLEAVVAAHQAGTLDQILAGLDPSKAVVFESPFSEEEGYINAPTLYDFPSDFDLGASVSLRAGGATRKGHVRLIAQKGKPVKAIIWSGREHTVVSDFLTNMTEVGAVFDGDSTFIIY